jgi:copper chaperone CopZ
VLPERHGHDHHDHGHERTTDGMDVRASGQGQIMTTRHATTIDLPVAGLDCASCAAHIEKAVAAVPGVQDVHVLVSAGRATIAFDPDRVSTDWIKTAIREAGYSVPEPIAHEAPTAQRRDVGQIVGWATLGLVAVSLVVPSTHTPTHSWRPSPSASGRPPR